MRTEIKGFELKVNYQYLHFTGVIKNSWSLMTIFLENAKNIEEAKQKAIEYHNSGVMSFINFDYAKPIY